MTATTATTATTTLGQLDADNRLFNEKDWKLNGAKITAIHGRDRSTAYFYDVHKNHVLVTVKNLDGSQAKVGAPASKEVTA